MSVKLGFISYGNLTTIINEIKNTCSDDIEFFIVDTALNNVIEKALELKKNNKIDVFISAGANAYILNDSDISPFVEIIPTITDFLFSLKEAINYGDEVAIITYKNKTPYISELKHLINATIYERVYGNVNEIDDIIDELYNLGVKCIIGSSLIREKALAKGMRGFMLYSKSSVNAAIDKAVNIAIVAQEKDRLNERLKAMMNITYEGIIATDKKGIIEIYNNSAERISGVSAYNAIGQHITKVLNTTRLDKVLQNKKEELHQTQLIGNAEVITNRVPIMINDEVVGAIATFQTIDIIKETEENIRRKLNKNGFVADIKFRDLIGESKVIKNTIKKAELFSRNDSTILITGESGTGKDLFAQGIHNSSYRMNRPFVAINCGALPENILESELFGYEEGAFTGTKKGGKPGVFELAHNGTIFLDEIGELPLQMQSRLLRVLENKEVLRVGGQSMIPINIRVIAATNKNLWELSKKGLFREDLYYRICVLELHIPPLRERKEDISLLIQFFLKKSRGDLDNTKLIEISSNKILVENDWNGNVRELKNIIERFSVLYNENTEVNELLDDILYTKEVGFKKNIYQEMVKKCEGNMSEAARRLNISRTTLWRKLKNSK